MKLYLIAQDVHLTTWPFCTRCTANNVQAQWNEWKNICSSARCALYSFAANRLWSLRVRCTRASTACALGRGKSNGTARRQFNIRLFVSVDQPRYDRMTANARWTSRVVVESLPSGRGDLNVCTRLQCTSDCYGNNCLSKNKAHTPGVV